MLFKHSFHQAIASGAITVTYRAWQRPRVNVGNRYRLNADGVVAVDEVRETPVAEITDAAACACGFASRDALLKQLPTRAGDPAATVFEVRFHYLPDPPTPVADVSADVSEDALSGLLGRLCNMDQPEPRRALDRRRPRPDRRQSARRGLPAGAAPRDGDRPVQEQRAQVEGARAHLQPRYRLHPDLARYPRAPAPGRRRP